MGLPALVNKTRNWDRATPADGDLFESEFLAAYNNMANFFNFAVAQLAVQRGFVQGRLRNIDATPTIIKAVKNNVYEVDGNLIRLSGDLSLDFSSLTNIFRNDGTTAIAATSETQNKHLYILLTTTGSLHAMIVPDAAMEGSSHVYANNPELLKDYYAASPAVWDGAKNGYYKSTKRIIGVCRLNGSNQLEFHYELGIGHRFMDVQHLPVGGKFLEIRWKREHPGCYYPDGATIATLATEAPELHRILGSTTLPDWKDRFARNIDLVGARSIRDVEADMFQGHFHDYHIAGSTNGYSFASPGAGASISMDQPSAASGFLAAQNNRIKAAKTDGTNGTPRTGSETRPVNYGELQQIVRG